MTYAKIKLQRAFEKLRNEKPDGKHKMDFELAQRYFSVEGLKTSTLMTECGFGMKSKNNLCGK